MYYPYSHKSSILTICKLMAIISLYPLTFSKDKALLQDYIHASLSSAKAKGIILTCDFLFHFNLYLRKYLKRI